MNTQSINEVKEENEVSSEHIKKEKDGWFPFSGRNKRRNWQRRVERNCEMTLRKLYHRNQGRKVDCGSTTGERERVRERDSKGEREREIY